MAKETYKILIFEDFTSKDGEKYKSGNVIKGKDFNYQMDFMMDNFQHKGKFKIEIEESKITTKQAGEIVKKTEKELYEESRNKFLDELSATELSSVREGKKKICHNQTIGFYLRLVSSKPEVDEIHISLHDIRDKEKRQVYASMKNLLLGKLKSSASRMENTIYFHNQLFDESDLIEMVEELFKGKC